MTNKEFLETIGPMAQRDMEKSGILASLTIAQAILESAWGRSGLTRVSNNLFGMKGDYHGQSVPYKTQEWNGSRYVTITDHFKKYPHWEASLADHSGLFHRLSRYQNLRGLKDYRLACRYVREDGYATDPSYTAKLIQLIERYQLTKWDDPAEVKQPPQPEIQPAPQNTSGETVYTVQRGDTLSGIAARYGTVYPVLAEYNGIPDPNKIRVGQVIRIPGTKAEASPKIYTVQKGDSWWRIASQQLGSGARMHELAKANGKTTDTPIHPGDQLMLP